MTVKFRISALNGLSITAEDGEQPTIARQPKRVALLAYLAVAGRPVTRDRLLALFWPESDLDRARNGLHQITHAIRKQLGDDALTASGADLCLHESVVSCDAREFSDAFAGRDFSAAVAAYRGPFLDGVHFRALPELERWIEATRHQLASQYTTALRALRDPAFAEGDYSAAIRWGEAIVSLDRTDSAATVALIKAHAQSGNIGAGLRVAEQHVEWMRSELDLPPSPSVQSAAEALRASAATSRAPSFQRVAAPSPARPIIETEAQAQRLAPGAPGSVRSARAPRFAVLIALSCGLIYLAAAGLRASGALPGWSRPTAPTVDWPSTRGIASVAVFPFRVSGEHREESWSDAGALLLAAGLDGAAGLHATDVSRMLDTSRLAKSLSLSDASAIATQIGVDFFVLGDVVESGGKLTLSANVYRSASAQNLRASAHASGKPGDLAVISDSIAMQLLVARGRLEPGQLVSSAARTTRSLSAFRSYLDGERRLRAGLYGEAMSAFKEALRADSDFALARYRLAMAAAWAGEGYDPEYSLKRLLRFADRLPERERLLVLARVAWERGAVRDAERHLGRILDLFPGDPEAAYQLGEVLFHTGGLTGRAPTEAGSLFARVVAIEPDNVEALAHLARVRLMQGKLATADSLSRRVGELRPPGDRLAAELRIMLHMAHGDRAWLRDTATAIAVRGDEDLLTIVDWRVTAYTDSVRLGEPFARTLLAISTSPVARINTQLRLTEFGVITGGFQEALRRTVADGPVSANRFLLIRAYLAALPFLNTNEKTLRAYRDSLETWQPPPSPEGLPARDAGANGMTRELAPYVQGLLALRLRDTVSATQAANRLTTSGRSADVSVLARRLSWHIRSGIARVRGDTAAALAAMDSSMSDVPLTVRLSEFGGLALPRYDRGELLRGAGRLPEAIQWYDTLRGDSIGEILFRAAASRGLAAARAGLGHAPVS